MRFMHDRNGRWHRRHNGRVQETPVVRCILHDGHRQAAVDMHGRDGVSSWVLPELLAAAPRAIDEGDVGAAQS